MHPLAAYAIVGLGAAAYSPAKYGILTELLPAQKLVVANGWIEGTTVASIILGVLLGGVLISGPVSSWLLAIDIPNIDTGIDTPPQAAIAVIMGCYAIAALINWYIPDTGAQRACAEQESAVPDPRVRPLQPPVVARQARPDLAGHDHAVLGRGRNAAVHRHRLGGDASVLQPLACILSAGRGRRSALRSVRRWRQVRRAQQCGKVLPLGFMMGVSVIVMIGVTKLESAIVLMTLIGAFAGFFVVPMNALLQHRGHVLMGAGHSIAVQNFNENIGVLVMLSLYAVIVHFGLSTNAAIVLFGLFVSGTMLLVMWRHRLNLAAGDLLHLVAIEHADTKVGQ